MPEPRPNILLIMSDQHHAGIMGCAGDAAAATPALDRLAADGVRFSNAYCTFPLCGPSRMSFMTCRHPHEMGVWDNEKQLDSDIPTFAHGLLRQGYETVLAGRMHFVGSDQRHGFAQRLIGDAPESVHLAAGWRLGNVLGDLVDTPGMGLAGLIKSGPGRTGYHAYDETVTETAVAWIRRRSTGAAPPFLLTVGYASPHCPFVAPPADFAARAAVIALDDLPSAGAALHAVNAERRRRFQTDPAPPLDAQWRTRVAYYGLCTFLDRQVGRLLDALAESGASDRTIVIYTSDHGEMLGEHGMWWKSTFYDGASRVPLIVSVPDGPHGATVSANVSLMDIGTTVLELAGADPLPGASGRSFRPLLTEGGPVDPDDTVFTEYAEPGDALAARMVRSGPWKFNYYHGMPPELFNLVDDPREQHDLSADPRHEAVRRRLQARALDRWDPERVAARMQARRHERGLLAHWVDTTHPAEPDPPWFDTPPLNWVDNTSAPPGLKP